MTIPDVVSGILYFLGILSLFGLTAFGVASFVLRLYRKRKQRQREQVFETGLAEIERSVAEITAKDLGSSPQLLPVRVVPTNSTRTAEIESIQMPGTTTERVVGLLRRRKPTRHDALVLHVRDFEIESNQPSPETQEDIIKWSVVVNTQRKSREYFPPDVADAIVKKKTEEIALELTTQSKVSPKCVEIAEREEVDQRAYSKVKILNNRELNEVIRSVSKAMEKGPSHIHEAREESRGALNKVFKEAVRHKTEEARGKLERISQENKTKVVASADEILQEAEKFIETNSEKALEYTERAEDILKSSLDDVSLALRRRGEVFPTREHREVPEVDWNRATLAKTPNVGRWAQPELDMIKNEFGNLSVQEVTKLRYQFGVILAYVYSFPGSTPNEIAGNTTLLPTTVAAEIHFLERLGYVRALTRTDRLPRKCYPKIDLSNLCTNASPFLGKDVLVVAEDVLINKDQNINKVVISLNEVGSSFHAVAPLWISEAVQEKMRQQRFCVGRIRQTESQERTILSEDYVIEVDDSSALAVQQSSGFESGMQATLEAFFADSEFPEDN